jgi:hypothetical protein
MHIEHIQKNADTRARLVSQTEFGVGHYFLKGNHSSIGRADNKTGTRRRYPRRIAEKINAPRRKNEANKESHARNKGQQKGNPRAYDNERPSSRVNGKRKGVVSHLVFPSWQVFATLQSLWRKPGLGSWKTKLALRP